MSNELELRACTPHALHPDGFNPKAILPHGLKTAHVHDAMNDFVNFLGFNGHPDMIPKGRFPNDAVQHADEGIEIKGSRYVKGWQGHNPEDTWLMVFVFDSNRPVDAAKGITPRPFKFVMVVGARLTKEDWLFAGRSATSRRTITASVTKSGYDKMMANWIYRVPDLTRTEAASLHAAPPPSE